MVKILFVCKGNICRSPAAEAYLKQRRPDLEVASMAHTDNTQGQLINAKMFETLQRRGIPADSHRKVISLTEGYQTLSPLKCQVYNLHTAGIQDPYVTGDFEGALDEIIAYVDELFPSVPKHWGDLMKEMETKGE